LSLRKIFSENRFSLFGIVRYSGCDSTGTSS
jgi:hypothetical protein